MQIKWFRIFIFSFCIFVLLQRKEVYAKEESSKQAVDEKWVLDYTEEIDCEEIQKVMEDILEELSFDFKEAIKMAIQGEDIFSKETILQAITKTIEKAFYTEKATITRVLVIAVVGALIINFSNVFQSGQVADTSFFITYLLLFSALSVSFHNISQTAVLALENLLEFMKVLLPAYFIAVTFATGSATSFVFYEISMMLVIAVEVIFVKIAIPLIHIYFVIRLVNYISKEDYLSKAEELLESGIKWLLRSLLGVATGYNFIQAMVVPVASHLKNSMVVKTVKLLPGIGTAVSSVAESVLGAGILVKNAVGMVGIFVIIMIISIPMIKIGFYCLLYKLGIALIQPVSDKRILECLEGASKGSALLLYVVFAGSVLFLLTIAIIMASTNRVM